jgi:hypothetical protein
MAGEIEKGTGVSILTVNRLLFPWIFPLPGFHRIFPAFSFRLPGAAWVLKKTGRPPQGEPPGQGRRMNEPNRRIDPARVQAFKK